MQPAKPKTATSITIRHPPAPNSTQSQVRRRGCAGALYVAPAPPDSWPGCADACAEGGGSGAGGTSTSASGVGTAAVSWTGLPQLGQNLSSSLSSAPQFVQCLWATASLLSPSNSRISLAPGRSKRNDTVVRLAQAASLPEELPVGVLARDGEATVGRYSVRLAGREYRPQGRCTAGLVSRSCPVARGRRAMREGEGPPRRRRSSTHTRCTWRGRTGGLRTRGAPRTRQHPWRQGRPKVDLPRRLWPQSSP